jgi:CDP-diacylglycerol--glycerol-3-phosphate 3-phosphatidyltransferase
VQIVSVVAAILAHRWDYWLWFPSFHGGFVVGVHFIAVAAIYWMTAISIISAVDYFVGFWKQIDHASERARTRRKSRLLSRNAKPSAPAAVKPASRFECKYRDSGCARMTTMAELPVQQ